MKQIYLGIKFALSYFTILPIRFNENDNLSHPRTLEAMILALPFIGALLAMASIGLFVALEPLGWVGALIAAVAFMVLYGFIHTEAIIDVADALYAAHSGKDPYAIIKDPTVGAMGVLYGVSFLILKISLIATLLMHHHFLILTVVAFVSRLGVATGIKTKTFRSTFVTQLHESIRWLPLLILIFSFTYASVWFMGAFYGVLILLGLILSSLLLLWQRHALGFLNGDTLGASLEICEGVVMLGALVWLH